MILNPFARVETIRGADGTIDGLRIVAPVKGRGLQRTTVLRSNDESGFVWRRRAVLSALLDAQSGRDPWPSLSDPECDFLERVGLFVTDAGLPREVTFDERLAPSFGFPPALLTTYAVRMHELGVVFTFPCVTRSELDEMRRYYRELVAEGFTQYGGEGGEPNRWVLHNDPLSRRLHPLLVPAISKIVDYAVKPSFSYLLVYLAGAALERHRDRAQCAITAVLQVDFDPEPASADGSTPWELHFERGHIKASGVLPLGAMAVFRGTELAHSREPLTCGRSSTHLAFCFVPEGFSGSLD